MENNNKEKIEGSVAKNTSYLTFALILQKIISLTYFTLLARNLGADNLGKYYFAISFSTIFAVITDLGMANVLVREIAKKKNEANNILGTVLAIKSVLTIIAISSVFIFLKIHPYSTLVTNLIYLSLTCVVLDSFTTTFWSVVRGFHNLFYESIASVFFQVITTTIGLYFLYSNANLVLIMSALLVASTFNFIYSASTIRFKIGLKIKPLYNILAIKNLFKITIPFALFAVFQRIYMYTDSILLKEFAGDKYVGYYQISFKIIFALQFLPMAFVASLYPAMSKYWIENKKQLVTSFEKALLYLMTISIPISIGVIALADKIILILKNGYNDAILPMQIIILSIMFIFLNFPIGALLNACNKQNKNTINMIIITIVSIAINLILIPRFKAVGASITVLISNILMTIMGIYWVKKTIDFDIKKIALSFIKLLSSGLIMGVFAFYSKTYLNILLIIPISAFIYFLLLFIFKTIKKDELIYIKNSFLKK